MNLGTDTGVFGDTAPEYNRTISDFFTIFIEVFSVLSAALKALFGTKTQ